MFVGGEKKSKNLLPWIMKVFHVVNHKPMVLLCQMNQMQITITVQAMQVGANGFHRFYVHAVGHLQIEQPIHHHQAINAVSKAKRKRWKRTKNSKENQETGTNHVREN